MKGCGGGGGGCVVIEVWNFGDVCEVCVCEL